MVSAVLAYLTVMLVVSLIYEALIFHPTELSETGETGITESVQEAEKIKMEKNGVELHGWLVEKDPEHVVIYFGGNAEEVSWMVHNHQKLGNSSLLLMNYRGFGRSTGKPRIDPMKEDSLFVHDRIKDMYGFEKFTVFGRSIGTGFATHLAFHRDDVERAVMVSPFTSLSDIASETLIYRPVSWFIGDRFNMVERAESLDIPLLMVAGGDDRIIPEDISEEYYQAWKGEKKRVVIEGRGHNDLQLDDKYWDSIREFLEEN